MLRGDESIALILVLNYLVFICVFNKLVICVVGYVQALPVLKLQKWVMHNNLL